MDNNNCKIRRDWENHFRLILHASFWHACYKKSFLTTTQWTKHHSTLEFTLRGKKKRSIQFTLLRFKIVNLTFRHASRADEPEEIIELQRQTRWIVTEANDDGGGGGASSDIIRNAFLKGSCVTHFFSQSCSIVPMHTLVDPRRLEWSIRLIGHGNWVVCVTAGAK